MVGLASEQNRERLNRAEQIGVHHEHARESWNALCKSFADAEFAQSFEWGEAKRVQGWQPIRLAVTAAGSCIGAVQALRRGYYGLPVVYCPRGPIWQRKGFSGEVCLANLATVLDVIRAEFSTATLLCDWHCADEAVPEEFLETRGFARINQGMTSWIDLRRDEQTILSSFHGKWRNDLQSAQRSGLTVDIHAPALKLSELYDLLKTTASRKGFEIGVDAEVVREFLALRDPARDVSLLARNADGVTLSTALVLSFNGFASYLLGASLPSRHPAFVRGASNLVQWEAIRWAKHHKHEAYNLEGLDQERNPGVYHFKIRMQGDVRIKKGLWMWTRSRFRTRLFGAIVKGRVALL